MQQVQSVVTASCGGPGPTGDGLAHVIGNGYSFQLRMRPSAASSACFRRNGERGFGYLLSRASSEADLVAFRSIWRHLALIGSPEAVGRSAIERRNLHGQRSREAARRGRKIAVPPRSGKRFETDDDPGRSRFAQPTGPEGRAYVRLSSRDLKKIQVSRLNGTCSATARVGRLSAVMRMSPAPLANNV